MVYRLRDVHLGRYRRIAQVLARHGLEYLIGVLGLERLVVVRPVLRGRPRETRTRPEHVRLALAELGATFIKLGQILSTRPDLLPPSYQREFARLQDNVPPFAAGVVEEVLAGEFGRPVGEVFAAFDPAPLAAASIGQAHAATLPDGAAVVVKVRRPGIVEQVAEDLEIMQNLAAAASRRWEFASQYDLVGLAQEFAQTLQAELDYLREGRNAERFAANFAGDPAIHIPRVYWETTTSRALTLERIEGLKIDDLAALDAAGIDRAALAERATRVILKMVFEDGFFHADPHPGNFFIEPGGRIGLIDFGMVGTVDEDTRGRLVQLLLAVAGRDAERMVDAFLDLGVARGRLDRHLLRHDLDRMLASYYDRPLGEIALGALLEEAFAVIRRHRLQLPANLALLLKTTVMAEGLGARLDPDFNLAAVLIPYAERLILREYSPLLWARRLGQATLDAARLGIDLPRQLRRIIGEFERGNLEVGMRPEGFEPLLRRLERLANRIVLGIIAAAFVNGLAVLVAVYHPPGWDRWAGAFVALGFFFASALGLYLAWTIIRSGRG
ncbi:MAG TPA: AarF/ABC1/UbiB kinase family protein [Thermomicrobiales bacterium]|nr:AarF/ABC1/UbiB kinase family protein [Thermomicrobiales bacterium]